jgi:hypothetical protein
MNDRYYWDTRTQANHVAPYLPAKVAYFYIRVPYRIVQSVRPLWNLYSSCTSTVMSVVSTVCRLLYLKGQDDVCLQAGLCSDDGRTRLPRRHVSLGSTPSSLSRLSTLSWCIASLLRPPSPD